MIKVSMIRGHLSSTLILKESLLLARSVAVNFMLLKKKTLNCIEVSFHPGGVGICVRLGADSCIVKSRKLLVGSAEAKWTRGRSRHGDPDEKSWRCSSTWVDVSDRRILLGKRPGDGTSTLNLEKAKKSPEHLTCSGRRSAVDWFSALRCSLAEKTRSNLQRLT